MKVDACKEIRARAQDEVTPTDGVADGQKTRGLAAVGRGQVLMRSELAARGNRKNHDFFPSKKAGKIYIPVPVSTMAAKPYGVFSGAKMIFRSSRERALQEY